MELLHMCSRTAIYISLSPHTATCLSPSSCYFCILILLCTCPHTAIYVSSYCYIRVLTLLYMCPHTGIHVSGKRCGWTSTSTGSLRLRRPTLPQDPRPAPPPACSTYSCISSVRILLHLILLYTTTRISDTAVHRHPHAARTPVYHVSAYCYMPSDLVLLYMCVLISLAVRVSSYSCMCPHIAVCVSSYCCICVSSYCCSCPHTPICRTFCCMCVLIPHTAVGVSSHLILRYVCPHTLCVYVAQLLMERKAVRDERAAVEHATRCLRFFFFS